MTEIRRFRRIGPTTDLFSEGHIYECILRPWKKGAMRWSCVNDLNTYSIPRLDAEGYWEELPQYGKSKMNEANSNDITTLSIEKATLINGKRSEKYTKEELLQLLIDTNNQVTYLEELSAKLGVSRYITNQIKELKANADKIKILLDKGE